MGRKSLSAEQSKTLLSVLKARFEKNLHRHPDIEWSRVQAKLEKNPDKLWSLDQMESTGGEPDVIGFDPKTREFLFSDCTLESPIGRRNLCYDDEALEKRKKNKPRGSALGMAHFMDVALMTEEQYRQIQELEMFDLKTSSWILTPETVRSHGGSIFCDRRYDRVFTYHNGADSYYSVRGFRAVLRV